MFYVTEMFVWDVKRDISKTLQWIILTKKTHLGQINETHVELYLVFH
jgi:hypothetical protein